MKVALVEKGCSWIRIDISVCKVGIPILDTLMGKRWYFVPFTLNILPIGETSSADADHVSSPLLPHIPSINYGAGREEPMTNKKRERKIFVSTHTIKSRSSKTFLNMENVKKV